MADEFIYCPRCGSDDIEDSDFESGDPDLKEVECCKCNWMGSDFELVCKDDEVEDDCA